MTARTLQSQKRARHVALVYAFNRPLHAGSNAEIGIDENAQHCYDDGPFVVHCTAETIFSVCATGTTINNILTE